MNAYVHDDYAAWLGECRCRHCQPAPVYPETDDQDERDDALEWSGVTPEELGYERGNL